MDWDIDMEDAGEEVPATEEPLVSDNPISSIGNSFVSPDDSRAVVANKLHIRGVDTLTTDDVKGYVAQHYGNVNKVEWIDDTSANLVFTTKSAAHDALVALSVMEIANVAQLPPKECIPAKPMASKPEINLQIRFAVEDDKKKSGAAARSRFYLLHPEFDPEERRRREGTRNRYRDRDSNPRTRRGESRLYEEVDEPFDPSLYDDDDATLAARASKRAPTHERSPSTASLSSPVSRNQRKELFPDRPNERSGLRSRDRSRSPGRDSASSSNNKRTALSIKSLLRERTSDKSKDLFPTKVTGSAHMDSLAETAASLLDRSLGFPSEKSEQGSNQATTREERTSFSIRGLAEQNPSREGFAIKGAAANVKELFPDKFGANAGRELFTENLAGRGQRRQRAEDLFH